MNGSAGFPSTEQKYRSESSSLHSNSHQPVPRDFRFSLNPNSRILFPYPIFFSLLTLNALATCGFSPKLLAY